MARAPGGYCPSTNQLVLVLIANWMIIIVIVICRVFGVWCFSTVFDVGMYARELCLFGVRARVFCYLFQWQL